MAEAELTTIARPYARAAFGRALDVTDGLAKWSTMLGTLAAAVATPVVREALDNPRLTTTEEAALLQGIMGDDLSEDGYNLLVVLAENSRLALIPSIARLFELLKANHEKTMEVAVTSAFEVSEQEKSLLVTALSRMLQRNISLETTIDKSLIGGVVIKAEDTVIDDSVRGRLVKLSHALD